MDRADREVDIRRFGLGAMYIITHVYTGKHVVTLINLYLAGVVWRVGAEF